MPIVITIDQKGARADTVENLVLKALKAKFPEAIVSVRKDKPAVSRADRFAEAQSLAEDAKSQAEELKEELENWKDNLPENLQSSTKADELDEAISGLEEFINPLEDAAGVSVDFPGMY